VVPDADVVMHRWFVYSDPLGHRGAFHSLPFYALLATLLVLLPAFRSHRMRFWLGVFVSLASHSLLDMLTDGGLGISLWWPFLDERLFFPWRPIPVSPLSVARFFSARGVTILAAELKFAAPVAVLAWWWSRARRTEPATPHGEPDDSDEDDDEPQADQLQGDGPRALEITEELDLHAFAPRDILDVVDAYLEAAQEKGLTEVRLIHGRGKGVQRAAVQRLLRSHPLVRSYRDAPPGCGGWGATIAWLVNDRDAPD
jgi:inner membrane protein